MVNDRAGQFMPFSPLKGFYDLIREKERIVVPRHEIAEDKAEELTEKVKNITVGMMVKVIYYSDGEYISAKGMVSKLDLESRHLFVVKTEIPLDDIWDIEF